MNGDIDIEPLKNIDILTIEQTRGYYKGYQGEPVRNNIDTIHVRIQNSKKLASLKYENEFCKLDVDLHEIIKSKPIGEKIEINYKKLSKL